MEKQNKIKTFDPRRYPVVTRVVDGYIEVSQPDLGLYRYKKKFDEIRKAEEIGNLVLDVMKEAFDSYMKATREEREAPLPSQPKGVLSPQDSPHLSIREVATVLKVSQDTVRRLCADGKLKPILTRGGHRRFTREQVNNFLGSV